MSNMKRGDDEWRPGEPLDLGDDTVAAPGADPPNWRTEIAAAPVVPPAPRAEAPVWRTEVSGPPVIPATPRAETPVWRTEVSGPPVIPAAPNARPAPPAGEALPARTVISPTPPTGVARKSRPGDGLSSSTIISATPPVVTSRVPTPPAGTPRVSTPPAGTPRVTASTPPASSRAQSAHTPPTGASRVAHTIHRATPPAGVPARSGSAPQVAKGTDPVESSSSVSMSMSSIDLELGTKLGQFELIRELGRGGMGQVFLARDTRLARLVALKFLGHASRELTERFLVEARATARCQHENIVVIYEADEWQGKPYMALEYLEGEPLSKLLERGTLAPSRALEIIVPVVRALARAHEHGIVHCDLKPDNIFVTREGVVKVLDFGIARALGQASVDVASGLKDSGISGTMPYMSPEQWGVDEIDPRTDFWALGIILWEMLCARHPLDPLSQQRLIHAAMHREQPLPSIGEAVPDCPPALEEVIDRCLNKHKEGRYANAAELLTVLEPQMPGRFGRRLDDEENPYPGMTAFQEGDADRFFGRDRDVLHMVTRMADLPLVGVVAPSGVGKSSFLRAGVIPALKSSGEAWEVFVTRPGQNPLASLATMLQPLAKASASDLRGTMQEHDALLARLRTEPGFLGAMLRSRARQKRERILLFIDQFEELYTLCPDPEERRAYTAVLAGIADDAATPLRIVVSMRSDFLDRAAEDRVFMERLTRGLLFLPPVDRDGMREALLSPLSMVGYRFEHDTMVDEMLDALGGASGALPLLQFTAAMLWDTRDRARRVLTAASYQEIGGVAGALASHADHTLAAMSPERQKLARAVFLRLVTADHTRAIVDVAELTSLGPDPREIQAVIDQVVAARLLVVQTREEGSAVEIVHESLLTRWPTLRRWLDESTEDAAFLEQLRTIAKQWHGRGRPQGLLWRGEAMEDARIFARRFKGELPERERSYLDAVLELATRASRRKRRLVIGSFVILGGLFAAAVTGMVYIRDAEQVAQQQRKVAETETQRAESETQRAKEAEAQVTAQLEQIKRAEAERAKAEEERLAAEASKSKAQESLASAESEVAEKEQDLAKANKQLQRALAEAKGETKRAEDASKALESALAREKAQVKALQDKLKTLATTLR
jgi:hypothetical protein